MGARVWAWGRGGAPGRLRRGTSRQVAARRDTHHSMDARSPTAIGNASSSPSATRDVFVWSACRSACAPMARMELRERSRRVIVWLAAREAARATAAASVRQFPEREALVRVVLSRRASAKAMPPVVLMRLRCNVRTTNERLAWRARARRAAPASLEAWLRSRSVSAHCRSEAQGGWCRDRSSDGVRVDSGGGQGGGKVCAWVVCAWLKSAPPTEE